MKKTMTKKKPMKLKQQAAKAISMNVNRCSKEK